jgi:enoyl-CoA hydratase
MTVASVPGPLTPAEAAGEVLVEERGPVLVLTINRPDQRNAMTRAVGEAIAERLAELDRRPDLSVGVLTGAGGVFCAGMDLRRFLAGEVASLPGLGFGGFTERPPAKPLIAAVEGYALAGGFELMLACDLVVAGEGARFGLPEVKRGLVARAGGLLRLPKRIPQAVALEVILTGDMLAAGRAAELGLVNRVVPDGQALAEALRLAGRIGANAPLAVTVSKRIVTESAEWPVGEAFDRQRELSAEVFDSEDAREGASAFKERREPRWRGR